MMRHCALFAAVFALLAGCSGKSGSSSLIPTSSTTAPAPQARTSVTFTMHWSTAGTSTSAKSRRPAYISPSARSVGISVNGATAQYLNAPSTTLTISAPAGVDTFAIQTFDEQNGQGDALSQANITQTVKIDTANVLSATLNGVATSVQVAVANQFTAGTAGTSAVNVAALDADGNTIVGPGDYSAPIKLSIQDPSSTGTLSLSTTAVQAPGAPVTLSYNGGTLTSANVVALATGSTNAASATVAPVPHVYVYKLANSSADPLSIVAGPDGNMWFTEFQANQIGKITLAGTITEYPAPANSGPNYIASSNGYLWFTEYNPTSGAIAQMNTAGQVVNQFSGSSGHASGVTATGYGAVAFAGLSSITMISDGSEEITGFGAGFASKSPTTGPGFDSSVAALPGQILYFTSGDDQYIGRIDSAGNISTFTVSGFPKGITYGPDGNLWYAAYDGTTNTSSRVVKFSPVSNTILASYTLWLGAEPYGITSGKDGAIWFTDNIGDSIGRLTTSGVLTQYPMPPSPGLAYGLIGIAAAPDGSIWACADDLGAIVRLVY